MTNEKTLELLNYAISEIEKEDENEEKLEMCYVLKKALEKQIPKKPKIKVSSGGLIASYYCPICGKYFGDRAIRSAILFHTSEHCECGQALDWSE